FRARGPASGRETRYRRGRRSGYLARGADRWPGFVIFSACFAHTLTAWEASHETRGRRPGRAAHRQAGRFQRRPRPRRLLAPPGRPADGEGLAPRPVAGEEGGIARGRGRLAAGFAAGGL